MTDPSNSPQAELERYATLLSEARAIKGVSLGKDAWRRLQRSRLAMASLAALVLISTLAFCTPLLPLAPPDRDTTALQYAEPTLAAPVRHDFQLDVERIARTPHLLEPAQAALAAAGDQLAEASAARKADRAAAPANPASVEREHRAEQAWYEARDEVRHRRNQINDIVQKPYRDAGFPDLGLVSRWMVRARYQLLGDVEVGPICGRDQLGRDVFSRLFWGARISLIVGLVATLVSLVIGVSYAPTSGYLGGAIDNAMMRLVDVLYSIPFIFVVLFLLTILGQRDIKAYLEDWGIDRITIFFFLVGAIYWLTMARVVRGQVISLKNEQFVEAARTVGASRPRIIFLHLVPNLLSVVIVYLTLTIPRVILFEAFLSFLGLGVEPPQVSWGMMANEGIKVITPVKTYWWLVVFPSLTLGVTLFALNFLGDGLRDALDPRMKHRT